MLSDKDTFSASSNEQNHVFLHRTLLDGTMTSLELSPDETYRMLEFLIGITQFERHIIAELKLKGSIKHSHESD